MMHSPQRWPHLVRDRKQVIQSQGCCFESVFDSQPCYKGFALTLGKLLTHVILVFKIITPSAFPMGRK